jgi:hypothetical protein
VLHGRRLDHSDGRGAVPPPRSQPYPPPPSVALRLPTPPNSTPTPLSPSTLWSSGSTTRSLVPVVLDLASSHYPRWCAQVILTLQRYALADHVLDALVAILSPLWIQMDSVVLPWLNSTITIQLQNIIRDQADTARQVWLTLEGQFLGNLEARALHLGEVLSPDKGHGGLSPRPWRANHRPYLGVEPSVWSQPSLRPSKGSHQVDRAIFHLPRHVQ